MASARRNVLGLTYADISASSIAHRIVHHAQNPAKLSAVILIVQKSAKKSAFCAWKNAKISAPIQSALKDALSHVIGSLVIYLAKKSYNVATLASASVGKFVHQSAWFATPITRLSRSISVLNRRKALALFS